MTWFGNSVAVAAIVALASAPLASSFAQVAAAQETLQDLAGRDRAEVAALPAEEQLDAEELDTLVSPVALYPDALLAQVLVAATYPLQIVKADRLLEETEGLSDDEVVQRIAAEDWDPSVMVLLSGFPTVVQRMADDLDWTERLGTAMVGQDQDVLAAVQRMRTQALDTGWLESNDAQVVERGDNVVSIRPADPDVVYVPNYDSSLAFTSAPTAQPYIAPRSNPLANPLVAGAMAFGAALLVQQLFKDDDDDEDRGWTDYWRRSEPFDWRDSQFYPRPDRGGHGKGNGYAWGHERDDHWDRSRGNWAYDARARAERDRERRAAVAWTSRPGAEGLGRIGELRTVARERPAHPPAAKPKPKPKPPAARSPGKPAARPAADRPAPPKPGARPDSRPPARAAKPAPKPGAVKSLAPKPAAAPKPDAKPRPKPDAKAAPNVGAKPKPAAKPKPDAKPAPKAAAKPRPKPDAKPAPKVAVKPDPKPEATPKVTAKPKTAKPKPEAKSASRPVPVAAKQPAPKKVAKPKPAAKPAAQAKAKPAAQAKQKPAEAKKKPVQSKPKAAQAKPAKQQKPAAKAKPAPKPAAKPKPKPKPAAKKKAACKAGDAACRK